MTDNFTAGKTAKSEQTRKRIVHTFLSLIEEKKWDKITVKELCARSEITRGTFYQYYSDIYELMEQIQETLLKDIQTRFSQINAESRSGFPIEEFLEKFDYEPPQNLIVWFDFCKDNQEAIRALLDLQNGDIYFEKKLKHLLIDTINDMMDTDGLPHDELRNYLVKAFSELHFLAARIWLESDEADFLSVSEVVNLLKEGKLDLYNINVKKLSYDSFVKPTAYVETECFLLGKKELGLLYAAGELAPYSEGATYVMIHLK